MQSGQIAGKLATKELEQFFFLQLIYEVEDLLKRTDELFISKTVEKFLQNKVFKNGKPLLNFVDAPEFKAFIAICQLYVDDVKLPALLRVRVANLAAMAYASVIPQSGLPLTHPCMEGVLTWHQKVINSQSKYQVSPELYIESCQYISGLYERRLSLDESYRQLAIDYFSLGLKVAHQLKNLRTTQVYLWDYANLRYRLLPAHATLKSEEVQMTLQAYLDHQTFCVENSKMLNRLDKNAHQDKIYIRQKFFNLFSGKWYFWEECKMLGYIQMAKIYFYLPTAPDCSPDYQSAANLLMQCQTHKDPFVQAAIRSEELKLYFAELPQQKL
jgi:hypothetical protein